MADEADYVVCGNCGDWVEPDEDDGVKVCPTCGQEV